MKTFAEYTQDLVTESTQSALFDQISKTLDVIRVGSKVRKALTVHEKTLDKNSKELEAIKKVKTALDSLSTALVDLADKI